MSPGQPSLPATWGVCFSVLKGDLNTTGHKHRHIRLLSNACILMSLSREFDGFSPFLYNDIWFRFFFFLLIFLFIADKKFQCPTLFQLLVVGLSFLLVFCFTLSFDLLVAKVRFGVLSFCG